MASEGGADWPTLESTQWGSIQPGASKLDICWATGMRKKYTPMSHNTSCYALAGKVYARRKANRLSPAFLLAGPVADSWGCFTSHGPPQARATQCCSGLHSLVALSLRVAHHQLSQLDERIPKPGKQAQKIPFPFISPGPAREICSFVFYSFPPSEK